MTYSSPFSREGGELGAPGDQDDLAAGPCELGTEARADAPGAVDDVPPDSHLASSSPASPRRPSAPERSAALGAGQSSLRLQRAGLLLEGVDDGGDALAVDGRGDRLAAGERQHRLEAFPETAHRESEHVAAGDGIEGHPVVVVAGRAHVVVVRVVLEAVEAQVLVAVLRAEDVDRDARVGEPADRREAPDLGEILGPVGVGLLEALGIDVPVLEDEGDGTGLEGRAGGRIEGLGLDLVDDAVLGCSIV